MAEKIQKVAFGLNELLRMQQSGVPADVFSELFLGTIESTDFFAATNLTSRVDFATLKGTRGDQVTTTVPAGEVWRVLALNATFQTFSLVGATVRAKITVFPNGGNSGVAIGTIGFDQAGGVTIVNVADFVDVGFPLPVPLVLMPGSTIQLTLEQSSAAGTFEMDLRTLYQRLAY